MEQRSSLLKITRYIDPTKTVDRTELFRNQSVRKISRNTPLQTKLTQLICKLIAGTPTSFSFASSHIFRQFITKLVEIGQKNPNTPLDDIVPIVHSSKISTEMTLLSAIAQERLLNTFRDHFVSVMFDEATINHKKMMAITIMKLEDDAEPAFYRLTPAPSTSNDYTVFVRELERNLIAHNIEITSIITDGLPAQLSGIKAALVSHEQNAIDTLFRPFHFPCLNHRVNLALVHTLKTIPFLSEIKGTLQTFAAESLTQKYQDILHKHSPKFVHTRWLCLSQICAFIRIKRNEILKHNLLERTTLINILMMEILLTPLLELQLFLESARTKLYQVFPSLIRTFIQYKHILKYSIFREPKWLHAIAEILTSLHTLTLALETGDIIALSFSLSPIGQTLFHIHQFASGYSSCCSLEGTLERLFVSIHPELVSLSFFLGHSNKHRPLP